MRKYEYIILLTFLLIYAYQLLAKFKVLDSNPWVTSYLADLLCIPLMLIPATTLIRLIKRDSFIVLNTKHILFTWLYVSITFEWILPSLNAKFTSDPFDVIYYFLGAIIMFIVTRIQSVDKQKLTTK